MLCCCCFLLPRQRNHTAKVESLGFRVWELYCLGSKNWGLGFEAWGLMVRTNESKQKWASEFATL